MAGHRKRLERDLDRWISEGLIDPAKRAAILASASGPKPAWSAAGAAAILGAVLLALAALTFVAANWAEMARAARFAVIIAALWAAFAGSAWSFKRDNAAAGHGLALLGAALFGAAIVLTAQTFNMSAFRNTGVLIWTIGALIAALAIPSRPVLILAALLGAVWAGLESFSPFAPPIVWGYAPVWLVTAAAAVSMRSIASWNLLSIGLFVWILTIIVEFGRDDALSEFEHVALFVLAAGATALVAASLRDRKLFGAGALANWGASLAVIAGWALQIPVAAFARSAERRGGIDLAGRFAERFGEDGGAYLIPALIAAGLIIAVSLLRRLQGRMPLSAAVSIAACAAAVFALPYGVRMIGPEGVFALRIALGALVYALAAGLVLHGAHEDRRYVGGLGVALFIAQSVYVYAVLFGTLLNTALFFLIGGLLFLGLSFAAVRWRGRFAGPAQPQGGGR